MGLSWKREWKSIEVVEGYEGYEGYPGDDVERMNICSENFGGNVGFRSDVFLLDVLGCWFPFLFKGFQLI